MAQSGYTPIQLYFSSTASNTPLAGNLVNGELAINIADGRLFYKDNLGVVQIIGTKGGTGSSSNTQVLFNSSGLVAGSAGLTWDGTNLTASQLRSSGLTSGRVTFAGASGLLSDSSNMTFNGTLLTVADLTDSSLTSGRVTYATTGGNLTDSANLTFDGTTLTAANFADSSLTSGRVTFAGSGGNLSDSANLTWNGSTLAITGALTATADSTFSSTGALLISKGTTAQQPGSPVTGMLRYNTTTNQFEGYSGSSPAWNPVGGATLSNDTSTTSNLFPLFANATSGSATTVYTSNAKLLYKPSTGEFQSSAVIASNGIFVNSQTVSTSYTVAASTNAMSAGPVTVADGVTVTVSDGSVWTVI